MRTALAFAAFLIIAAPRASAQPAIAVNGVVPPEQAAAAAGSTLSVSVSGGPGNATDWVALATAGTADTSYLDWRYLNGATAPPSSGLTSATLAFTAPVIAGSYELRFFVNNTYQRVATTYDGYRTVRHVGGCAIRTGPENHLTTTSGGDVASDVTWDQRGDFDWYTVPVEPVLQLEDQSFAGVADSRSGLTLLVFDATGHVKWSVSNAYPVMTTPGSGLVASMPTGDYQFDVNGDAVARVNALPTFSWMKDAYVTTNTEVSQIRPDFDVRTGAGWASEPQGNPSTAHTFVSVYEIQAPEGFPLHGLTSWGRACPVVAPGTGTRALLDPNLTFDFTRDPATGKTFEELRTEVLQGSTVGTTSYSLATPNCVSFFSDAAQTDVGKSFRIALYNRDPPGPGASIRNGVSRQRAFSGNDATMSLRDAGVLTDWDIKEGNKIPRIATLFDQPVCQRFLSPKTHAASQATASRDGGIIRDTYINVDLEARKAVTAGTILHETLHNLTGLNDFISTDMRNVVPIPSTEAGDLKTFIGIVRIRGIGPTCVDANGYAIPGCVDSGNTDDITQQLIRKMCVAK